MMIMGGKFDKKYFDEEEFNSSDPWGFFTSEYEQRKYKRQIQVIRGMLKTEPEKFLEIGCAEGAHTKMLAEEFYNAKIVGIDISENAIKRARENIEVYKDRVKLINADILEYINKIPKNSFDVVIYSETIYYLGAKLPLTEMYDYLDKLVNTLKPEGMLVMANIINQPNAPETPLTRGSIMDAYYSMLSKLAEPIHKTKYNEFKKEENQTFEYQIWGFRK